MATLRVGNRSTSKTLAMYLEAWGEDYWLRPGEDVTVTAGEAREPDVFSVDMHEDGIQLWVERAEAVVRSADSGAVLECGHQRPA